MGLRPQVSSSPVFSNANHGYEQGAGTAEEPHAKAPHPRAFTGQLWSLSHELPSQAQYPRIRHLPHTPKSRAEFLCPILSHQAYAVHLPSPPSARAFCSEDTVHGSRLAWSRARHPVAPRTRFLAALLAHKAHPGQTVLYLVSLPLPRIPSPALHRLNFSPPVTN